MKLTTNKFFLRRKTASNKLMIPSKTEAKTIVPASKMEFPNAPFQSALTGKLTYYPGNGLSEEEADRLNKELRKTEREERRELLRKEAGLTLITLLILGAFIAPLLLMLFTSGGLDFMLILGIISTLVFAALIIIIGTIIDYFR